MGNVGTILQTATGGQLIETISRNKGEPEWVRQKRLHAWQTYLETPLPSAGDEAWRRTSLAGLDLEGFVAYHQPGGDTPAVAGEADGSAGLLVQRDSAVVHRRLEPDLAARGLVFTDLETAAREHPEVFRRHFMTELVPVGESKFTALHAALWSGGAFLYVPDGVEVAAPLRYAVEAVQPHLGLFNHVLIIAGAGSRVTLLETAASADPYHRALHCGVVEVVAGPGARVRFGNVQRWGGDVHSFTVRRAALAAGAAMEWFGGEFGGRLARAETLTLHQGEGARSRAVVAYFGAGRQHLDVGAGAIHVAPNTESEIVARGVVGGEARAVYRGLGHIHKGARRARMRQSQRALLLSREARSDAIPSLLIDEKDVQAGHAAAAGPVDREMVFYLMSRGIPEAKARRMLVHGFLQPLLDELPLPDLHQALTAEVDGKLDAAEKGGE